MPRQARARWNRRSSILFHPATKFFASSQENSASDGPTWRNLRPQSSTHGSPVGRIGETRGSPNWLERKPNVKAVLSQACETSTAVLHPIREMSKLIHERTSALFLVDAITAMGCMKMPMKEWDLDVVVAGSQKAFMLPTGLSFVGVSKRALDIALKNLQPKFYFDWQQELEANAKNASFFSSPTTLINSLQVILTEFERVGIAAIQAVVRRSPRNSRCRHTLGFGDFFARTGTLSHGDFACPSGRGRKFSRLAGNRSWRDRDGRPRQIEKPHFARRSYGRYRGFRHGCALYRSGPGLEPCRSSACGPRSA